MGNECIGITYRAGKRIMIMEMKRNTIIKFVARIVGVVILILGIRMIAEGAITYIEQHQQTDWIVINAEVTDVSSRLKRTKSQYGQRSTVYDITYEYEVNEEIYSDEIRSQPTPRLVGDDIKVKYNPDAPEESTTSLSPSVGDLLVFAIFGLIFSTIGFFLSGAFILLRKLLKKGKLEEQEELPPEEYIEADNEEKKQKSFIITLILRIGLAVIAVSIILLSSKLLPGTQAADTEAFREIAEATGYTTTDSTEKLRQEWRVGSMLTEAISFDNGMIRMDFCVMDTVDSAASIYNGMTLPIADGEITDNDGIIHEIYSVEDQTNYVAKIRIKDTIIYVFSLAEYKNDVIELLESIGYWKN